MVLFHLQHSSPWKAQRGFSMIEVLVTMLIVSLALLGTAGLQAYSMRLNQGGQFRTQAVFLASDLAERIEANKAAAVAGAYALAPTQASGFAAVNNTTCLTGACNAGDLALFDLAQWQTAVADPTVLPQSSWSVAYVPTTASVGVYTITISWVDRRTDTSYSGGAGTGETFSYTATRTVSN